MGRAAYADLPAPAVELPSTAMHGDEILYFALPGSPGHVPDPDAMAWDWPAEVLARTSGREPLVQQVIDVIESETRRAGLGFVTPPAPRPAWSNEYEEDGIDIEAEVDAPIERRLELWEKIAQEVTALEDRTGDDDREFLQKRVSVQIR